MTDLYSGQITDILCGHLKNNPEVQALAHAVMLEKQRIILLSQRTRIESAINDLAEATLDVLAVELRTQYYSRDLPLDEKRELIKNTYPWYKKAGTLSAVRELAETVYGDCTVEEWFDYDGEPGYFRVKTPNFEAVYSNLQAFLSMLRKVKRLSAHIEKVQITSDRELRIGIGFAVQRYINRTIYMDPVLPAEMPEGIADELGDVLADEVNNLLIE